MDPAEIHRATARGDLATVTRLLDAGVPVGARDANEWTPLHVAVACGQLDIVALLLARHADVTAKHNKGSVPLLLACNKPLPRAIELLLAAGADANTRDALGDPALSTAAMFGQVGVMEALVRGGAIVSAAGPGGRTALIAAADNGHAEAIRVLLRHGAAVDAADARGCTALHFAATHGHLDAMTALLDAGADVNAVEQARQTPLMYAAQCRPEAVALLLARGAHVNARAAHDVTALHAAARHGMTSAARVLLDHGAELEAHNDQGGTPLFGASVHRRRDTVALLLARGANFDAPNREGASARSLYGAAKGVGLGAVPLGARNPVEPTIDAAEAIDEFFTHRRRGIPLLRTFAENEWRRLVHSAAPDAPIVVPDGRRVTLLFSSDFYAQSFRSLSPWLPPDVITVPASGAAVFAGLPANLDTLGINFQPKNPDGSLNYGADQLDTVRRVGKAVLVEQALVDRAAPLTPAAAARAAKAGFVVAMWAADGWTGATWVGPENNRSRLLAVLTDDGRVLLPIMTLDDAAAAFQRHTRVSWATGQAELAQIPAKIFGLDQLPVDGAIINPYGPGPTRILSLEECAWIVQAGRLG